MLEVSFRMMRSADATCTCTCAARSEEVSPWDAASDSESFGLLETEPVTRVGAALGPKAHVLVCAPSNSALDEIVARLLQYGLLDWCARQKGPNKK